MSSTKNAKSKIKFEKQKGASLKIKKVSNEENASSSIELEEDDPCICEKDEKEDAPLVITVPGPDPRFQQQNQTHRCFIMYCDFYHCEHLLGEGAEACTWFKKVFETICPRAWIENWDDQREKNIMPWHKDAEFAEGPYGKCK